MEIENDLGKDANGMTIHEKLDELIDDVNSGGSIEDREALANAITSKGVQTNVSDQLSTMAENVLNIDIGIVSKAKAIAWQYYQQSVGTKGGGYNYSEYFTLNPGSGSFIVRVGVRASIFISNGGSFSKTEKIHTSDTTYTIRDASGSLNFIIAIVW